MQVPPGRYGFAPQHKQKHTGKGTLYRMLSLQGLRQGLLQVVCTDNSLGWVFYTHL